MAQQRRKHTAGAGIGRIFSLSLSQAITSSSRRAPKELHRSGTPSPVPFSENQNSAKQQDDHRIKLKNEDDSPVDHDCKSENQASEQAESQNKAPGQVISQEQASEQVRSQDEAPEQGKSQDQAPEQVKSQDQAPEQVRSQNQTSEQVSSQDQTSEPGSSPNQEQEAAETQNQVLAIGEPSADLAKNGTTSASCSSDDSKEASIVDPLHPVTPHTHWTGGCDGVKLGKSGDDTDSAYHGQLDTAAVPQETYPESSQSKDQPVSSLRTVTERQDTVATTVCNRDDTGKKPERMHQNGFPSPHVSDDGSKAGVCHIPLDKRSEHAVSVPVSVSGSRKVSSGSVCLEKGRNKAGGMDIVIHSDTAGCPEGAKISHVSGQPGHVTKPGCMVSSSGRCPARRTSLDGASTTSSTSPNCEGTNHGRKKEKKKRRESDGTATVEEKAVEKGTVATSNKSTGRFLNTEKRKGTVHDGSLGAKSQPVGGNHSSVRVSAAQPSASSCLTSGVTARSKASGRFSLSVPSRTRDKVFVKHAVPRVTGHRQEKVVGPQPPRKGHFQMSRNLVPRRSEHSPRQMSSGLHAAKHKVSSKSVQGVGQKVYEEDWENDLLDVFPSLRVTSSASDCNSYSQATAGTQAPVRVLADSASFAPVETVTENQSAVSPSVIETEVGESQKTHKDLDICNGQTTCPGVGSWVEESTCSTPVKTNFTIRRMWKPKQRTGVPNAQLSRGDVHTCGPSRSSAQQSKGLYGAKWVKLTPEEAALMISSWSGSESSPSRSSCGGSERGSPAAVIPHRAICGQKRDHSVHHPYVLLSTERTREEIPDQSAVANSPSTEKDKGYSSCQHQDSSPFSKGQDSHHLGEEDWESELMLVVPGPPPSELNETETEKTVVMCVDDSQNEGVNHTLKNTSIAEENGTEDNPAFSDSDSNIALENGTQDIPVFSDTESEFAELEETWHCSPVVVRSSCPGINPFSPIPASTQLRGGWYGAKRVNERSDLEIEEKTVQNHVHSMSRLEKDGISDTSVSGLKHSAVAVRLFDDDVPGGNGDSEFCFEPNHTDKRMGSEQHSLPSDCQVREASVESNGEKSSSRQAAVNTETTSGIETAHKLTLAVGVKQHVRVPPGFENVKPQPTFGRDMMMLVRMSDAKPSAVHDQGLTGTGSPSMDSRAGHSGLQDERESDDVFSDLDSYNCKRPDCERRTMNTIRGHMPCQSISGTSLHERSSEGWSEDELCAPFRLSLNGSDISEKSSCSSDCRIPLLSQSDFEDTVEQFQTQKGQEMAVEQGTQLDKENHACGQSCHYGPTDGCPKTCSHCRSASPCSASAHNSHYSVPHCYPLHFGPWYPWFPYPYPYYGYSFQEREPVGGSTEPDPHSDCQTAGRQQEPRPRCTAAPYWVPPGADFLGRWNEFWNHPAFRYPSHAFQREDSQQPLAEFKSQKGQEASGKPAVSLEVIVRMNSDQAADNSRKVPEKGDSNGGTDEQQDHRKAEFSLPHPRIRCPDMGAGYWSGPGLPYPNSFIRGAYRGRIRSPTPVTSSGDYASSENKDDSLEDGPSCGNSLGEFPKLGSSPGKPSHGSLPSLGKTSHGQSLSPGKSSCGLLPSPGKSSRGLLPSPVKSSHSFLRGLPSPPLFPRPLLPWPHPWAHPRPYYMGSRPAWASGTGAEDDFRQYNQPYDGVKSSGSKQRSPDDQVRSDQPPPCSPSPYFMCPPPPPPPPLWQNCDLEDRWSSDRAPNTPDTSSSGLHRFDSLERLKEYDASGSELDDEAQSYRTCQAGSYMPRTMERGAQNTLRTKTARCWPLLLDGVSRDSGSDDLDGDSTYLGNASANRDYSSICSSVSNYTDSTTKQDGDVVKAAAADAGGSEQDKGDKCTIPEKLSPSPGLSNFLARRRIPKSRPRSFPADQDLRTDVEHQYQFGRSRKPVFKSWNSEALSSGSSDSFTSKLGHDLRCRDQLVPSLSAVSEGEFPSLLSSTIMGRQSYANVAAKNCATEQIPPLMSLEPVTQSYGDFTEYKREDSCKTYFRSERRLSAPTRLPRGGVGMSAYSSRLLSDNRTFGCIRWGIEAYDAFYKHHETPFIDTHCHLDMLFSREQYNGSFSDYREKNASTFPSNFEGCVAVFCNPNSFGPNVRRQGLLNEAGVYMAMGCHPKSAVAYNEWTDLALRQCLKHPRTVALGEIGLDYSKSYNMTAERQKEVFIQQLKMALELKLPLVIHCREAEDDCLEIMEEHVPKNYKIHCHCFTGNFTSCLRWITTFPNLFIGLTPLVTYQSATDTHEVAMRLPLDKLLLETDAPYFIPCHFSTKQDMTLSHPGLALMVAVKVAELRNMDVEDVLKQVRQNTRNMYGI